MSGRRRRNSFAVSMILCILLCCVIGLPLFLTVSVSLQTMREVYSTKPIMWPQSAQWGNYVSAMHNGNWARYLSNSLYVAMMSLIFSLLINSSAGYAFARIPFRGRNILFAIILVGIMVPPQVTMVPVFTMLRAVPFAGGNNASGVGGLGLLNTYGGLILPYIAGSFGVFMCRQYYSGFPLSLDDAARIDGCSRILAYAMIYLPLSGPLFATLGVLKFIGSWNEYTWPLVMTQSDSMKTVQLALTMFRDEAEIRWTELMAATIISSMPIYILCVFCQKYFVSGLLDGSVKG